MKFMVPPLSLIFLFFTLFTTAQDNQTSIASEMDPEKSILKNTEDSENHKTLLAVMRAADLEDVLGYDGPFTVFAPSDTAFEKLPRHKVAELLNPKNKKQLHDVMTYHIVAGNLSASKILKAMCRGKGKATFTTVHGDEITATMNGIDIVLTDSFGNSARITTADANQCNGVIHEIDSVILPGKF
ncbi:MAG: fasciclin domain-containing protein [Aurantibacter sp.]